MSRGAPVPCREKSVPPDQESSLENSQMLQRATHTFHSLSILRAQGATVASSWTKESLQESELG